MRVSGIWTLFGAIITGLVIADLWRNSTVTSQLIKFGGSESTLLAGR